MLLLLLALELKQAGLRWFPQLHDFFTIPDTELQDRIFVVSDMTIDTQKLFGQQMITFNGAVEWSLDYVLTADAVWLPTERQLRQMLLAYLSKESEPTVELISRMDGYLCRITASGKTLEFEEPKASDAYGRALLYLLINQPSNRHNGNRPVA